MGDIWTSLDICIPVSIWGFCSCDVRTRLHLAVWRNMVQSPLQWCTDFLLFTARGTRFISLMWGWQANTDDVTITLNTIWRYGRPFPLAAITSAIGGGRNILQVRPTMLFSNIALLKQLSFIFLQTALAFRLYSRFISLIQPLNRFLFLIVTTTTSSSLLSFLLFLLLPLLLSIFLPLRWFGRFLPFPVKIGLLLFSLEL